MKWSGLEIAIGGVYTLALVIGLLVLINEVGEMLGRTL